MDDRPLSELKEAMAALKGLPIDFECGSPEVLLPEDTELVIPSPGVPPSKPVLITAESRGIPVNSEIELACRFITKPIIAVTGTNGKTTTTELI
ncbi:MAG: hypothetical protein PHU03_08755, partial [Syntrophales bacterium]|nr:hypothetical protein [Syntrophales bacterium]